MDAKYRYLPATEKDIAHMLDIIGLPNLDALYDIPEALKFNGDLPIPPPLDEWRLTREIQQMASENLALDATPCFLGAGMYDHFIPAAVHHLTGRSEFWTAYTPYQAEMSQGLLQAIFEYQSLLTSLTGMDGANASLYDGATALLEGALLAVRATNRKQLIVAESIHPEYRKVLSDVLHHADIELVQMPYDMKTGKLDMTAFGKAISSQTAAIILQSPNFFGVVEDIQSVAALAQEHGAQCNVSFDPVSLGVLKSPGAQGADIASGEGQPLGIPMSFGGPGLGLFAVKNHLIRQMPGRLVGETKDQAGRRGFVLTLQAREQHIRRERAASNICTNQALCALTATIHLSLLGSEGLKTVAQDCLSNAVYLCDLLVSEGLAKRVFDAPYFREFAVYPILSPETMNSILREKGILGGLDLTSMYPELRSEQGHGAWLIAVTEKRTKEEMHRFVAVLKEQMMHVKAANIY